MYIKNTPCFTFILVGLVAILPTRTAWLDKLVAARIKEQRVGWLDRFVSSYKAKSHNATGNTTKDCLDQMENTVKSETTIVPKPQGYGNSKNWTFDSVSRLSTLLSEGKKTTTVRQTLRHIPKFIKKPTRRLNIPMTDTFETGSLDKLEVARVKKQRVGWLERFIFCHKTKGFNATGNATKYCQDQMKDIVKFEATIMTKPQGYKNSKNWTFQSASRFSTLLTESKTATTVHQARRPIRKFVKEPTGRLNIAMKDTFKAGSLYKLEDARVKKHHVGWLDRFIFCHKTKRLNATENTTEDCQDQMKNTVQLEVTIVPKPQGYEDSKNWTFDSVSRLLTLISESKKATPVRRALRRILQSMDKPTRRLYMPMKEAFMRFPSLTEKDPNVFYYDAFASDYSEELEEPADDSIVIIRNPVESKLPSQKLSVNLLKDIMIQRALKSRMLPLTAKTLVPWDSDSSSESSYSNEKRHGGNGKNNHNGNYNDHHHGKHHANHNDLHHGNHNDDHHGKHHGNHNHHHTHKPTPSTPSTTPAVYTYNTETKSSYSVHNHTLTWQQASNQCKSEGAELLIVNDAKEADIVTGIIKKSVSHHHYEMWTGIQDKRPGGVMDWRTVHGEPLSKVYNQWGSGRPSNDARWTCAEFYANDKRLYDVPCTSEYYYTCEKSK